MINSVWDAVYSEQLGSVFHSNVSSVLRLQLFVIISQINRWIIFALASEVQKYCVAFKKLWMILYVFLIWSLSNFSRSLDLLSQN